MNRSNAPLRTNKGKKQPSSAGKKSVARKDFWDTIAEDVASGYGARNRDRASNNSDQLPDDNRRGDEETGRVHP